MELPDGTAVLSIPPGATPIESDTGSVSAAITAAIAAACTDECWSAAELLFALSHFIEALLLLSMALASGIKRGWPWAFAVSGVVFAAVFLWPGYLADGSLLMATPSSGGVRALALRGRRVGQRRRR